MKRRDNQEEGSNSIFKIFERKKPKQVVIRNTSTAMGAALAAALAGSDLAVVDDGAADSRGKNG